MSDGRVHPLSWQVNPPNNIYVTSTYDGMCHRVTWSEPVTWEGISGFNVYVSSTEFNTPMRAGFVPAGTLTFYHTPPKLYSPFSGGGKWQDSRWFYRIATISCYNVINLSSAYTTIDESSLDVTQLFSGITDQRGAPTQTRLTQIVYWVGNIDMGNNIAPSIPPDSGAQGWDPVLEQLGTWDPVNQRWRTIG